MRRLHGYGDGDPCCHDRRVSHTNPKCQRGESSLTLRVGVRISPAEGIAMAPDSNRSQVSLLPVQHRFLEGWVTRERAAGILTSRVGTGSMPSTRDVLAPE